MQTAFCFNILDIAPSKTDYVGGGPMTKAEVQYNIRYNENLVSQYQRDINNLNRQISSCRSTINQLNSQLSDLASASRRLQTEYDELSRLRQKFQKLQTDFASRQAKRVAGFAKNTLQAFTTNFFSSYLSGMKTLLSGSEYRNTYNGLTTALERIKAKIQAKQREIDSNDSRQRNVNNQISSKNREINNCRSRIAKTNDSLAYRRRRIQYWKEQLQYATN